MYEIVNGFEIFIGHEFGSCNCTVEESDSEGEGEGGLKYGLVRKVIPKGKATNAAKRASATMLRTRSVRISLLA